MADDGKSFLALLNGLTRKNYYGQTEINNEFLKEQIYPNLSQEEFDHVLNRCQGLLKSMVSADMDMTQLEAFLTAQSKKRDAPLTEDQAAAIRKFWKSNKTKIHDSIISQTMWGNTLQKVSWRIDLQSQSRHVNEINAPTAIMELQIGDSLQREKAADVVRFEMTEDKLGSVLKSMQVIEDQINQYTTNVQK
ncbi:COMM domain-containing protein 1-like [Babylonia areolata]|uniref:COMM domain-containing protein 1-like n=1 Tax=Babylonia areolata TaxID=304850 RepID=UPI003FD2521A